MTDVGLSRIVTDAGLSGHTEVIEMFRVSETMLWWKNRGSMEVSGKGSAEGAWSFD